MEPDPKPEGGQGTPAPAATTETPAYLTQEHLDQVLSGRLRGVEQKVEKTIAAALEAFGGKLRTELASLLPAPKEPKPEAKKPEVAPDPELKKLQDQVTSLTRDADEARSQRDVERAKVRDATLRQRVGDILATAGIEGVRARHAVGLLVDSEKRVRWSDEGDSLVFHTPGRDDAELEPGLRAWLRTEDARLYLPPKGAQGSGDRPNGGAPTGGSSGPPDRAEVAEGLRRALLGQL